MQTAFAASRREFGIVETFLERFENNSSIAIHRIIENKTRTDSNTCSGQEERCWDVRELPIHSTADNAKLNSHLSQVNSIICIIIVCIRILISRLKRSISNATADAAYHTRWNLFLAFKFHVWMSLESRWLMNRVNLSFNVLFLFPFAETTKFFTFIWRCNEWRCKISGLGEHSRPTLSATTSRLRRSGSW